MLLHYRWTGPQQTFLVCIIFQPSLGNSAVSQLMSSTMESWPFSFCPIGLPSFISVLLPQKLLSAKGFIRPCFSLYHVLLIGGGLFSMVIGICRKKLPRQTSHLTSLGAVQICLKRSSAEPLLTLSKRSDLARSLLMQLVPPMRDMALIRVTNADSLDNVSADSLPSHLLSPCRRRPANIDGAIAIQVLMGTHRTALTVPLIGNP
jgi:hypothetical protein